MRKISLIQRNELIVQNERKLLPDLPRCMVVVPGRVDGVGVGGEGGGDLAPGRVERVP